MSELHFRLAFVVGPFMFSALIPTAVFGSLIGELGTNLCRGSVFGLRWLRRKTDRRGRRIAMGILSASLALVVPSHFVIGWDAACVHLPDYTLHVSGDY